MFIACGLIISNIAFAQAATKFGYINSNDLLNAMPEKQKADTALNKYAKSFQDELEQMQKEGQKKLDDFQASQQTMTDAIKEVKTKELEDLQARIQSVQQSAQEKIQEKRTELYTPILSKAQNAIKEVAAEKGYDYIFDTSVGALVYQRQSDDIMPLVKAKLGIK